MSGYRGGPDDLVDEMPERWRDVADRVLPGNREQMYEREVDLLLNGTGKPGPDLGLSPLNVYFGHHDLTDPGPVYTIEADVVRKLMDELTSRPYRPTVRYGRPFALDE